MKAAAEPEHRTSCVMQAYRRLLHSSRSLENTHLIILSCKSFGAKEVKSGFIKVHKHVLGGSKSRLVEALSLRPTLPQ